MTMPKYTQLPGDQPPEYINLPDGRQIRLVDIMGRRSDYESIRIGVKRKEHFAGRKVKYTLEERHWIATSSISDVMSRYQVDNWLKAWSMITYNRDMLGMPKVSRKTWPR